MTRVVCQQLAPRVGALDRNGGLTVSAVRDAASSGAALIVLPELATSGYVFGSREEAVANAITPDHSLFAEWAAELAGTPALLVGGFCELDDGCLYNSAAVVDQSGLVGVYRKTHLWDREQLFFEPGDQPPPIFDTPFGRIGVLICYDLEFPEMTRTLALRGADAIAVPANWPLVDRPQGERPPEVIAAMAAARTNRVFVACCDRTGVERGVEWTNGTCVINESGWVIADVAGVGAAVADVDFERARSKSLGPENDAFGDRRPELYGDVTREGTVDACV